jgi:phosphatidylglycerol---prolipoprotein diacylglyceryl transferase
MRSVLIELGPWTWLAFPLLWAALFVFVLLWQRIEDKAIPQQDDKANAPPMTADLLGSLVVSLVAALVLFFLVNKFAPLAIKSYGVMMLIGFTVGAIWMAYAANEDNFGVPGVIDVALAALVGGIVGSRIVYVLLNIHTFTGISDMFDLWAGGLSFHGGVGGGIVSVYLCCRWRGYNFLHVADLFGPGLALGYVFARIGCFLNGCCHGTPTDLPWAVTFPSTGACTTPDIPVHPTQLYASALSLLIFAILVRLRPHMQRHGHLFLTYLMFYSMMRFGLEFTRAGATARYLTDGFFMTEAQLASLIIFLLSGILLAATWPRSADEPSS